MKNLTLLLLTILYINSCSRTVHTWQGTPIKEYLEVYGKDDLPSMLEKKGVEHRCVDLVYSSEKNTKKCYVLKNSTQKIDGWSSRLYETSKGALLDTGENILILGVLVACSTVGSCTQLDISKIKLQ